MPRQAAMVFSWGLKIGGVEFERFGNISISHSLSGYGNSGVVTSTMTVTTYHDTISGNAIANNAEVVLTCSDTNIVPPKYWVTSRRVEGNVTVWTCADRMSKTELTPEFAESDFTDEYISWTALASKIQSLCGFSAVGSLAGYDIPSRIPSLSREYCEGCTVRSILETLSEALCGYWITDADDKLIFVPFGQYYRAVQVNKYSDITPCGTKSVSCILMTDGDDMYAAGSGSAYQTIRIDTPLASAALASLALSAMPDDFTYTAWKCDKGLATGWIYVGAIYFYGGSTLLCNNVTLYPSTAGLFFTASANAVTEDEAAYIPDIQRQIDKCVALGRLNGNAAMSKKGLYFFENGYKQMTAAEQKNAKYGFTVASGGITEYDGAMVSKVVPSSVTWNFDKTEALVSYGEKKYKYGIQRDSDGNITNFTKEEVTE